MIYLTEDPKCQCVYSQNTFKRPWGTFTYLAEGDGYVVKELMVNPGQRLSKQYHQHRTESWTFVSGEGCAEVDGVMYAIGPAFAPYLVEKRSIHRIINTGTVPLVIVEVWMGTDLREDDITRLDDDYDRIPWP